MSKYVSVNKISNTIVQYSAMKYFCEALWVRNNKTNKIHHCFDQNILYFPTEIFPRYPVNRGNVALKPSCWFTVVKQDESKKDATAFAGVMATS